MADCTRCGGDSAEYEGYCVDCARDLLEDFLWKENRRIEKAKVQADKRAKARAKDEELRKVIDKSLGERKLFLTMQALERSERRKKGLNRESTGITEFCTWG